MAAGFHLIELWMQGGNGVGEGARIRLRCGQRVPAYRGGRRGGQGGECDQQGGEEAAALRWGTLLE